MIRLFLLILCVLPAILYNVGLTDFGVLEERKNYEYANVIKYDNGRIAVNDSRINSSNIEKWRLSPKHEEYNEKLYDLLCMIEGCSTMALYKGIGKGILTMSGIGNFGGGSTLYVSIAGSLMGKRTSNHQGSLSAVMQRFQEIMIAGYLISLPKEERIRIILSEACQYRNMTGCSIVANELFENGTKNLTERQMLVLAASVRYPISERNYDKLIKRLNAQCQRDEIKEFFENEFHCHFKKQNLKENGGSSRKVFNQYIKDKNGELSNYIKFKIVNDIEESILKTTPSFNFEVSIARNGQVEVVVSNNEKILKDGGFGKNQEVASVAKLIPFIQKINFDSEIVSAMAVSDNEKTYDIFSKNSDASIILEKLKKIQINLSHEENFFHNVSYGYIDMSSFEIHQLVTKLSKMKHGLNNELALKAAVNESNGTLAYTRKNLPKNIRLIVAKSGTQAKGGVRTKLAVFGFKEKNSGDILTVVIRVHAHHNGVICKESGCSAPIMNKINDIAFVILKDMII